MNRKTTIWRIPAFGIVAGVLWFFLNGHFLGSLSLVTLPDNTVTVDPLRALLLYALEFAVTLAYCGLWVTPKMTRKEVLRSSLVLCAFMAVSVAIQAAVSFGGMEFASLAAFYLAEPFEWCGVINSLTSLFTQNPWVGAVLQCFAPLAFVPLGKKEMPDYTGTEA